MHKLRKNSFVSLIIAVTFFLLQSNLVYAGGGGNLPNGYTVANGNVTFTYNGNTLTINNSNRAIINWLEFNIGAGNTVNFYQPNANSYVLNRVTGVNPSVILGILNSFIAGTNNTIGGNVFVVNPNGVFFGQNSQVNVNGLVASTLNISDNDFINGNYHFTGQGSWIINKGNIHVSNGGYVLLLSNSILNTGTIEAKLGHVVLAAGEDMTVLNLDDNGDMSVTINQAVSSGVFGPNGKQFLNAIDNKGSILADGGTILLNAKVLNGIFDNAVNNAGVIQANSLVNNKGNIEIVANGGNIESTAGSVISAKAADSTAQGGTITLSSTNDTNIDSGALIDVSGGSQSGDAGSVDISALGDVNFSGTLNGQAADGYNLGNFIIDPTNANIQGVVLGNTTVWATNNITITGDVFDLGGTLNLYADHNSKNAGDWNDGVGAIIDTGGHTIYGSLLSTTLNLEAGSGIGSLASPILVSDINNVSAQINPTAGTGGIYIKDTGIFRPLTITSASTNGGDINLTSVNTGVTLAGNVNAGSGKVTINAKTKISQISGTLTANGAELIAGTDISMPNLSVSNLAVNAGGDVSIVDSNAGGLTVDTVGGTTGITANSLSLEETLGDITIFAPINLNNGGTITSDLGSLTIGNPWVYGSIYTANGDLNLNAGVDVNISGDLTAPDTISIDAGRDINQYSYLTSADTISLDAGRNITQQRPYAWSWSIFQANNLELQAGGDVTLSDTEVGTVAGDIGGSLYMTNTNASGITIGSVGGINGLTVGGNNLDITETTGDIYFQDGASLYGDQYNLEAPDGSIWGPGLLSGQAWTWLYITQALNIGKPGNPLNTALHGFNVMTSSIGGVININQTGDADIYSLTTQDGWINFVGSADVNVVSADSTYYNWYPGANIHLSAGGNIYLDTVNAGTANIGIKAGGSILDGGASALTGNKLWMSAVDGIGTGTAINTFVNRIKARVSGSGGVVNINQTGNVVLDSIKTNDGDITIKGSGWIDAKYVKSHGGDIDIKAHKSIKVGLINAGWGDVDLAAFHGSIFGGNNSLVKGYKVSMFAKYGIGSHHHALKTDARELVAVTWGHHAGINLDNISHYTVKLEYVSTNGGDIKIKSNGSIDAKNVKSRGGDITLDAKKNIEVGRIDAGWGNVNLIAVWGSITGSWNSLITGNNLFMKAKKGIGSNHHALRTDVRSIEAIVTGHHGGINIDNISHHTVKLEYVSTHGGDIKIKSNGSIDAKDVKSRGGDITLDAKKNIEVGRIDAGWGNVNLIAVWGSITGSWNSLITGNNLFMKAKKGIGSNHHALRTDVRSIEAIVTGHHGGINIDNISHHTVKLEYVSTHGGDIKIKSNGSIDAKDVKSRGGDITLDAKKNIEVGRIDAGWGNVNLIAVWGSITGSWNSLITGNNLFMKAKKGIGSNHHALRTDVRSIEAIVTGHHGGINLDNISHHTVKLEYVSTNGGDIKIKSNGSIDAKDVKSRGGDITLDAKKNIEVGRIDAGWGNVNLIAVWGSITGSWNSLITGNNLFMKAKKGIGSNHHALRTDVRSIEAIVTGHHGGINIDNISHHTVTLNYVSTHGGDIKIKSNGSIDAKNVKSRGGDITLDAKKNIEVGRIDAGWGNVNLIAVWGSITGSWNSLITGNNLFMLAKKGIGSWKHALKTNVRSIEAIVTGHHGGINLDNISHHSVKLEYVSTNGGDINVVAQGSIYAKHVKSNGGFIDISSAKNIDVGHVNASTGNVELSAGGSIDDKNGHSHVTGNNITFYAVDGIGATNAINTTANSLDAQVVGIGNINLNNINTAIDGVALDLITTADGSITVTADGTMDVGDVDSSATDAAGNDVTLTATNGDIYTGTINAGANNGNVTLNALNGSILYGSLTPGATTISANNITLNALNDIGSASSRVYTNSNLLNVTTTTGDAWLNSTGVALNLNVGGSANLLDTGGTIIDSVTTGGDFTLEEQTGDIDVDGNVTSGGNATLTSDLGSIDEPTGGATITGSSVTLNTPNGTIGLTNPINVDVTGGNLTLNMGPATGSGPLGNIGFLTGTVAAPGGIVILPGTLPPPNPYGKIFFNGVQIWPPVPAINSLLISIISATGSNKFVYPVQQSLSLSQVNKFDPSSSANQTGGAGLFLYHPLSDVDSGAFDQEFQLDEGAYDFIDGQIEKKPLP